VSPLNDTNTRRQRWGAMGEGPNRDQTVLYPIVKFRLATVGLKSKRARAGYLPAVRTGPRKKVKNVKLRETNEGAQVAEQENRPLDGTSRRTRRSEAPPAGGSAKNKPRGRGREHDRHQRLRAVIRVGWLPKMKLRGGSGDKSGGCGKTHGPPNHIPT